MKQCSRNHRDMKQILEIVEKHFPVKSTSQNLREIEFVENMRASFRNCRETWKQVPEIVEKGGFFQFVESRIKYILACDITVDKPTHDCYHTNLDHIMTANWRWYAYGWLIHDPLMAQCYEIIKLELVVVR